MALTEKNVYQVEVTETDHVQVRTKRIIMDDGVEISSSLHRHVVSPGQDYTGEIGKVRRVCDNAHVPTVVDKHQKFEAKEMRTAERQENDTQETQDAEAAAEAAYEAAEAAHEAFLESEDI